MKRSIFVGMLCLALTAASLGLVGCGTTVGSSGGAIDAIGVAQAGTIQYYAAANFELTLMRTKNGQPDTTAAVSKGVPSYTREKILIPLVTPGVLVKQETTEDGKLILTIAFEEDETLTLSFIQSTQELGPHTGFILMSPEGSEDKIVQYGNNFYSVRSYFDVTGRWGLKIGETDAPAILGIYESVTDNIRTAPGRKL